MSALTTALDIYLVTVMVAAFIWFAALATGLLMWHDDRSTYRADDTARFIWSVLTHWWVPLVWPAAFVVGLARQVTAIREVANR